MTRIKDESEADRKLRVRRYYDTYMAQIKADPVAYAAWQKRMAEKAAAYEAKYPGRRDALRKQAQARRWQKNKSDTAFMARRKEAKRIQWAAAKAIRETNPAFVAELERKAAIRAEKIAKRAALEVERAQVRAGRVVKPPKPSRVFLGPVLPMFPTILKGPRVVMTLEERKAKQRAKNHRPEVKAKRMAGYYARMKDPAYRAERNAVGIARFHAKKKEIYAYRNHRANTNINVRLGLRLRGRVSAALRYHKGKKAAKTEDLVGCTVVELKRHLERQFVDGMCWERFAEIEIDHITPCAMFDLSDPDQQKLCFHWTNLQPLWASDNRAKKDKLNWQRAPEPASV